MELLKDFLQSFVMLGGEFVIAGLIGFILYKVGLFRDMKSLSSKQRKGKAFAILVGCVFLISGSMKIIGLPMVKEYFELFNLAYLRPYLGVFEVTLAVLLVIPKTYKIGLMLGTGLSGGLMATHLPIDGIIQTIPTLMIIIALWLSAIYYTPEVFPDYIVKIFNKSKTDKSIAKEL